MHAFYNIHIRPWLIAGRSLAPRRSIVATRERQRTMNILGVKISVDRNPGPKLRWTRRVTAVAATGAVVLSGGVAYAIWTTTGSGSGTASARSFTAPTVTAGTAPSGQLYPGLTADGSTAGGDLALTVTNPNPFPVTITSVAPGTGSITVTNGTNNTTCAASTGVSIISKSNPSVVGTIAANATNVALTIQKVVSMSTASDTGCQGATFTFPSTGVSLGFSSP